MVKFFITFAILTSFCFGANIFSIVDGILGQNSAKANALFSDGRKYIDENGRPDIAKISNALKSNSLLTLAYKNKVNLEIRFICKQNSPLLLMKIVKDALNGLGFNEILTTEFSNAQNAVWGVRLNTKFILDPGSLYTALKSTNTLIDSIERTGTFSYTYVLDTSKSALNLTPVEIGEEIALSKPLEPYFIEIGRAKSVQISAQSGDSWFALVRFLDKNLNLIDERQNNKKTTKLNLNIPANAKYLMIDDANSLENIKRGLKIYIK